MDDQIIKEYNNSEVSFNKKIKNNVPLKYSDYYYLIKENWFNKLTNLINCKKLNI